MLGWLLSVLVLNRLEVVVNVVLRENRDCPHDLDEGFDVFAVGLLGSHSQLLELVSPSGLPAIRHQRESGWHCHLVVGYRMLLRLFSMEGGSADCLLLMLRGVLDHTAAEDLLIPARVSGQEPAPYSVPSVNLGGLTSTDLIMDSFLWHRHPICFLQLLKDLSKELSLALHVLPNESELSLALGQLVHNFFELLFLALVSLISILPEQMLSRLNMTLG